MGCSTPDCPNTKILAKGLCQACYHRAKRTGSVERTYVRNSGRCSVEGCDQPSFAKNLCPHHYGKAEHPLKFTWRNMRSRNKGDYPISWDRFEAFLAEIGDRPSPQHQLRRIDGDRPWSASNCRWLAPINPGADYMAPEHRAAYGRAWHLSRRFNLTGEEYAAMLAEQGGGCAICGQKETAVSANGKIKDLAVDHDHETGVLRGLLCFNHNQGIGRFQNDPALLRAAADYLEAHASKFRCETVAP